MVATFVSELGKKLAERWVTLLVLPGALYLAVLTTARVLGHGHALDLTRLAPWLTATAASPAVGSVGGQVVLAAGVLGAAAALGVVAQATGTALERMALAVGWQDLPTPLRRPVHRWVGSRRDRWRAVAAQWDRLRSQDVAAAAAGNRNDPAPRRDALRAMRRVAVERPERPTWSGDRLHGVAVRLERDLGVDVARCWPPLWLLLPEDVRAELTAARANLARAAALGGWAVLYAPLAYWWWPALPVAVVMALVSWRRIRAATEIWAQMLEAACRLHLRELAERLGVDTSGPPVGIGQEVTRLLEGTPPRPPF
ncbi:hypothetical protein ACIBJE_28205 [Micromonospora sp. NPDC050187]|uniref:hypothetical protein n=1 Tax=Micromonospora sp. NPDC050187 TaxID=3364277 RepID=UPI0037B7CF7B